ncbi:MAG: hypothetical protein IT204_05605 [Fimbriimonadaceae bacterium]|nr:hypothetical protein [Fimbriimonadaceae bacterium]
MEPPDRPAPLERGLTLRSLVLALALAFGATLWIRRVEMISHTTQISEAVPVVPAVAALALFLLLNPLLTRLHPRLALRRAELVVIFVVMSVAPTFSSVGMMRMMLPATNVAQYFATPENGLAQIWELIPSWYGPRDPEVIRELYEGAAGEAVPWGVWLQPMLLWGLFALAIFGAMLCLNLLLRKQWTERERLSFPLVQFVLTLTPDNQRGLATVLRNPLFWVGIGVSFIYNLLNMLHAVNPAVPAPGVGFQVGGLFTERPWSALSDLNIAWRPEIFGLGYLMSTEITLSCWVFYLLVRLSKVLATMTGAADRIPGFPFDRELCMGGYLALTLFVVWVGRRHLWAALQRVVGRGDPGLDAGEAVSYRAAFAGLVVCLAFILGWAVLAGMALWLALLYFGLILGVALTYTRIRAETGAPMVWLFPYWEQQKCLTNLFGSARLAPGENFQSLAILHGFAWLARGFYPTTAGSQIEALRLGDEVHARRRDLVWALLLAAVIGFGLAAWSHLDTFYQYGGNVLERGTTDGGYRIKLMRDAQTDIATWIKSPLAPDLRRNLALFTGFLITGGLVVLRAAFLRFPLHPLGFAMTLAHPHMWGPSLLVWIVKSGILRVGGVRLYKQLIPLFVGIVLGHFFTAGVLWGTVAVFNEELAEKYGIWFG